jgi:hypothetical protein
MSSNKPIKSARCACPTRKCEAPLLAAQPKSRPHLHAYLQKIHARPAYLRALERGDKYDFGPK